MAASRVIGKDGRRESKKARLAFGDYCAMGPGRSLDALHARYVNEKSAGRQPPTLLRYTLGEWCRRYGWVARVAAYDADIQQQARLAQIKAVREMATNQAEQGRRFQALAALAAQRVDQYLQLLRVATVETIDEQGQVVRVVRTDVSPAEMAALLRAAGAVAKVGADMERLALGEATERIDLVDPVELARKWAREEGDSPDVEAATVASIENYLNRHKGAA